MRNLKMTLAYNGTNYHGWQIQPNCVTIQQIIEDRLSRILDQKVGVNGCSRTDAGVHAREYVLSVRADSNIPCAGLVKAMNAMLPEDIAVLGCEDADEDFHARFSCKGKEYVYILGTAPCRDVFGAKLKLHYPYKLDEARLDKAAGLFVGTHDFGAFCKAESKALLSSTVRTIYSYRVRRDGDTVTFTVRGDGFLHNMVRITVGTLIYINENKRAEYDIISSLETGERSTAGVTVPAHGLYLNRVFYSREELEKNEDTRYI